MTRQFLPPLCRTTRSLLLARQCVCHDCTIYRGAPAGRPSHDLPVTPMQFRVPKWSLFAKLCVLLASTARAASSSYPTTLAARCVYTITEDCCESHLVFSGDGDDDSDTDSDDDDHTHHHTSTGRNGSGSSTQAASSTASSNGNGGATVISDNARPTGVSGSGGGFPTKHKLSKAAIAWIVIGIRKPCILHLNLVQY